MWCWWCQSTNVEANHKQVKELEEAFKSVNKALQEAEAGLQVVQDLPSADLPRPVSLLLCESGEPRWHTVSYTLSSNSLF